MMSSRFTPIDSTAGSKTASGIAKSPPRTAGKSRELVRGELVEILDVAHRLLQIGETERVAHFAGHLQQRGLVCCTGLVGRRLIGRDLNQEVFRSLYTHQALRTRKFSAALALTISANARR